MPKVSVIMAAYNCEKTVGRAIESILAQTFTDWELIICDDASTDHTGRSLKEYKRQYPEKIILIKNSRRCYLAHSLNRCLKIAKGEYIARMDADDISLPERFQTQVDFLDKHPDYMVVGTAMIPFDAQGKKAARYMKTQPQARDLVSRSPFAHATIMMRKSAYTQLGGYTVSKRTRRGQDYDLWFRFFALGEKGYNLQEPLYLVLEDSNSFKRRTFETRMYSVQTKLIVYKRLHYPIYKYVFAFKPLIASVVPAKLLLFYHRQSDKMSKKNIQ